MIRTAALISAFIVCGLLSEGGPHGQALAMLDAVRSGAASAAAGAAPAAAAAATAAAPPAAAEAAAAAAPSSGSPSAHNAPPPAREAPNLEAPETTLRKPRSDAGEPSTIAEPGAQSLVRFACPNGLEVVVDRRPGTRTVFMEIGVRVGSRDEPLEFAGMSHLLEHLLFKEGHDAAARRNPAFSALRAVGAEINATTDFELTEYHADVPAARFREGWNALVALVTATDFSEDDLRRERNVVLGEVRLGKTDPLAIMAYSVLRRVFPGDPVGQPVIGFRKTLKKITKADVDRYYLQFYDPANMFAVVVGDVDTETAATLVRETLGAVPARGPTRAPYPRPAPRLDRLYRFRTLVTQSYLIAGALTRGNDASDAPALELLASILGDGRTSRLHRSFVERDALTDEVLAISFSVSNVGAFGCGLTVERRKTDEARAALLEEMVRLTNEPVSEDELDTAKTKVRGALALQLETNDGSAGFRARRLFLHQPVSRDAYLAAFDALTADDLLRVARAHWGVGGPVAIEVLPARGFGKVIAALKFLIFRRL